jgi:hypothetical protein
MHLLILFIFPKNRFWFIGSLYSLFGFDLIDLTPDVHYSSLSAGLGLFFSYFSRSLRCIIKFFIWELCVF